MNDGLNVKNCMRSNTIISIKKALCLFLLIFAIGGIFSGCYDSREVDDLAYVIAIGLDKGKTNFLKMTLQIATPSAVAKTSNDSGGQGGGGGNEGKGYMILTIETPSFYSGLNMANTFISKQLNLSHAKAVIFSRELAMQGTNQYLRALARGREFRPNLYVMVSRGSAEDFLRNVKPLLVINPAKYYELTLRGYTYTSFIANTQFHFFYSYTESLYRQPVAILAGVNKFEASDDFSVENSTFREKGRAYPLEGDFKAGDLTKSADAKTETMGLAVFDADRMIGELDGEETAYYLMVSGDYKYSYWTFPDPKVKDRFVILNVQQKRNPKHTVEISNGRPQIYIELMLEADIVSVQSTVDYERGKNLEMLQEYAEDFIKTGVMRFLRKTAVLNADICGLGAVAKRKFITWQNWEDFNWKSRYGQSVFDVQVDLKIRRPGLLVRTMPSIYSGNEEAESE